MILSPATRWDLSALMIIREASKYNGKKDVWVDLYGKDFADKQVMIESEGKGIMITKVCGNKHYP
jgi:hypothetical protein